VVINPQLFLRVFYAENKALNSFYQMAKYSWTSSLQEDKNKFNIFKSISDDYIDHVDNMKYIETKREIHEFLEDDVRF
jgi:hypothetical protein